MCKKAIVLVEADQAQPTGGIFYTKDEEARHCRALLYLLSPLLFLCFLLWKKQGHAVGFNTRKPQDVKSCNQTYAGIV